MNINSTIELSFDLAKSRPSSSVRTKQYDEKTRSITVKLTENGKTFKKPENAEIKLCGTKPDSSVFELLPSSENVKNGKFTFFLTDYVLSADGIIRCDVKCCQIIDGDPYVCSTDIFYIHNVASAVTPGNEYIGAELQSVERATAAALGAAEVAAQTVEALLEARNKGEFNGAKGENGYTPKKGVDYFTESDKTEIADEVKASLSDDGIPAYWESHLAEKIRAVQNLQNEGGKDCFSFVVMTDMHYPSNLGKNAPLLAKRILDKCDIKYAMCLGDVQTRGCHATKELLLAENEKIDKMLSPIRNRLLQTEGNHDGSYGFLDRDGNGVYNNSDSDGNTKVPAERETYVNNLAPAEIYNSLYRKVGLVGDATFDESGSGYYIDDTASKVRYIVLNTTRNDYELQEDGTAKYPKMWLFRFTQSQFDLVIEALNGIPSDSWSVVVAGHCPLWQEIGDANIMSGVLNAYKNKTAYNGEYIGTASGGAAYKNLAEPLPDNTTDTTKWVNGYRYGSSGEPSTEAGTTLSNPITVSNSCTIRIKGATLRESKDRIVVFFTKDDGTKTSLRGYYNSGITNSAVNVSFDGMTNDEYVFTVAKGSGITLNEFRFAMKTPSDASKVIVTVNEEIIDTQYGYDYVSVDADFSKAKGELVGYFAGHVHYDRNTIDKGFPIISTRCDAREENDDALYAERVAGTITEQSFDVFTVNKLSKSIYATKIGAGDDRIISFSLPR